MTVEFILLILAAYLLGSVPASYLAAKWSRGIDIRQYGSGNIGATNLLKFTSKRIAIPVIIFDLGKGMVMVWATQLMGLGTVQQVTIGLAAIIGHNWSVFLRFNGGRGVLTTLGVITILVPWIGLIIFIVAYSLAPFHHLALGVLLAVITAPTTAWFFSQPLGVVDKVPILLGFVAMLLIAVIRRLTAPRTPLTDTVPKGQLFINRLFLDRDIRDRETWIRQVSPRTRQQRNKERR